MNTLESKQINMKNHCKAFGRFLHILFWLYLIVTLTLLLVWGVCALITPESLFTTEQYGNAAKVGFYTNKKGFYLFVTNTSFSLDGYSSKKLYGLIWVIAWGYQVMYAAILWCLSSIFRCIKSEGSPFTLFCSRLVRYIGLLFYVFSFIRMFLKLPYFLFGDLPLPVQYLSTT